MRYLNTFFIALIMVVPCLKVMAQSTTKARPPDISGTWEIIWIFNEVRGNLNEINPCRGPFPYQYRFSVDIMQDRNNAEKLLVCYQGLDCSSGVPWGYTSTLQQASLDAISNNCGFQPHSVPPLSPTDPPDGYSESPVCQGYRPCISGRTTELDILPNCGYPDPCPRDTLLPYTSRLFGMFQLPANVWAKLCHQWDFLEPSSGTFHVPLFAKAWRHMNETWAFVPDIKQCPCYPGCKDCGRFAFGTGIFTVDDECMQSRGLSTDSCGFKLVGATGGAVVFPESTTGVPQLQPGVQLPARPQTCWMYADIEGRKTRSREQMLQDHPEWQ